MLFISNEKTKLSRILRESLEESKKLDIVVAYAKARGIQILKFFNRNTKAKIRIVAGSDWLMSDIRALSKSGFSYRIHPKSGFHPKIYIFYLKNKKKRIIVGSSNLTEDGMCMNLESNLVFESKKQPKLTKEITKLFNKLWKESEQWSTRRINQYHKQRKKVKIKEGTK